MLSVLPTTYSIIHVANRHIDHHRPDQVKQEIGTFLQMLSQVYGIFGLDYSLKLSTRPEKYLGELSQWNDAERALEEALNATGRPWELNEGDGAFYGPKIDIAVMDALRRKFQCATVQLDFQLPQRFKLQYMTEDGYGTPVMVHRYACPWRTRSAALMGLVSLTHTHTRYKHQIHIRCWTSTCELYFTKTLHRAILGSVERMFAILTEHFAGKWPLWLSPRQVMVVPISEVSYDYARHVRGIVRAAVRVCNNIPCARASATSATRASMWMQTAQTARCRKRSGRRSWHSTTTFWCEGCAAVRTQHH